MIVERYFGKDLDGSGGGVIEICLGELRKTAKTLRRAEIRTEHVSYTNQEY
jgi:hypothetical protein